MTATDLPLSDPVSPLTPVKKQPLVNIPPLTLFLILLITAIHLIRVCVLSEQDDRYVVVMLGFMPDYMRQAALHDIQPWINLVSYSLLHFGWAHFFVNVTALAAFGSAVERMYGARVYAAILLTGILVGALVHFAVYSDSMVILGGISAGISALFALILGIMQEGRAAPNGWRRLAKPIFAWVLMNILIGLMGMPGQSGLSIGWVAHLGGFAAGLAFLPYLFPRYRLIKTSPTPPEA